MHLSLLQDLSNVGDVTVSFDPFTPTRIADANVTVARDASSAVVTSSGDLRNFLSPGVIIRIGGEEASADGTLTGTNGEGYLDYPGGVGHRCVLQQMSRTCMLPRSPNTNIQELARFSTISYAYNYSSMPLMMQLQQYR